MRCYRDLFGTPPAPGAPETRSEAQILVWQDLEIAGYAKRPVFVPDRQGNLCSMRASIADGRRSLFLYIESNVNFTAQLQSNPPTGETKNG